MSAIHVVVRQRQAASINPEVPSPRKALFDVVVDGVNLTAKINETSGYPLLLELCEAVFKLTTGRATRESLVFYADDEAWELALEADGDHALISVFRGGANPEIAVHHHRVGLSDLRQAVSAAIDRASNGAGSGTAALAEARQRLERPYPSYVGPRILWNAERVSSRVVDGLAFAAELELRRVDICSSGDSQVERSDLHSLLALGRIEFASRSRTVSLVSAPVFLIADRLLTLAEDALGAWRTGRALFRRVTVDGARLGVQRGPGDVPIALTVSSPKLKASEQRLILPEISTHAFVQAAVDFAKSLSEAFCRNDPNQHKNLRLSALRRTAEDLGAELEQTRLVESLTNSEPESYRSYGLPARGNEARGRWAQGGKMRFLPRWVATVPNIDLAGTFLCGDKLIVGSNRETACIDRGTGGIVWRIPTVRAPSVVTPSGLIRLHPDGRTRLHDLATGEVRFTARLGARSGRGVSGALVHAPGLPRLLITVEGDRVVTALDLVTGDIRWRYTGPSAGTYKLRRAGKLLLLAGGDSTLSALDVTTGNVVWRLRDRLPFTGEIAIEGDSAFALCGGPIGPARLYHLDLWIGKARWVADLDERFTSGQAPLVTSNSIVVATSDRRGTGLSAFTRESGRSRWTHEPGFASPMTAFLPVDDTIVANSAGGTLMCIDADTGSPRYNHVFPVPIEADQPRRLEPVLRNGALFVPQHRVHVVRPVDGEIIGTLPSDLIPDLLRVDERCDVYVAEESGHLACFGAAPRLTLVK